MAAMHLVASDPLEAMTAGIFEAAGTPADLAAEVARHLVSANLAGHDSHGVIRIPAYLQQIESGRLAADGRPVVVHETAATAIVDANRGFGQVGAAHALPMATCKASSAGVPAASKMPAVIASSGSGATKCIDAMICRSFPRPAPYAGRGDYRRPIRRCNLAGYTRTSQRALSRRRR